MLESDAWLIYVTRYYNRAYSEKPDFLPLGCEFPFHFLTECIKCFYMFSESVKSVFLFRLTFDIVFSGIAEIMVFNLKRGLVNFPAHFLNHFPLFVI